MSTGPMPSADRRTTLLALVRRTNRLMVEELVARLESAGYADITPAQHLVFENIDAAGTRLTTLAQRAGMTRQTMTELVNGLARRGYLELVLPRGSVFEVFGAYQETSRRKTLQVRLQL